MRVWVRPLLILILAVIVPLPAWSVIVTTKDGKEYKGILVKNEPLKVTIRLVPSGEEKSFFRFDISRMVEAVKKEELEKLKPSAPEDYYNLALGLISQREDPEAHHTALRLFLISAYLNSDDYGQKALSKMSVLARNTQEARAFRAMAYLLDIIADKSLLKQPKLKATEAKASRDAFIQALELLRRGKTKAALKYANMDNAKNYFAVIPGLMSYQEFVKICHESPECKACNDGRVFCSRCNGKGAYNAAQGLTYCKDCNAKGFKVCKDCKGQPCRVHLDPRQKQIILQLQLAHEMNPNQNLDAVENPKADSWSSLLSGSQVRPIPVLSVLSLTEFDPRKCVYKDGEWVQPEK